MKELSDEDVKLLNTKIGLRFLYADKHTHLDKALRQTKYEFELRELQAKLVDLQRWVIKNNKKVVILFEGRDAAGKGGAIRRVTSHINPRYYRIVALNKPTEEERGQWYFQRYVINLPKPGEIVFFDRSWYNRAVVEPVNKFCTNEEYHRFMNQVNDFEKMLIDSNTFLIKLYFSITKKEQEKRLNELKKSPLKRWKITAVDLHAQELWDEYTKYKLKMFEKTNLKRSPWIIIKANKKTEARINALKHILNAIPYEVIPDDNKSIKFE